MNKILDVYLHDTLAGQLSQNQNGELSFSYGADYLTKNYQPLSVSMPLREQPYDHNISRPFFSGLLPDDTVRHKLARFLGVSEKNPFALLEAIGGECAGALSLHPHGPVLDKTHHNDMQILTQDQLYDVLQLLKRRPLLAGQDGMRLSLAGAQDKLAVAVERDQIVIMKGVLPTTHILKPVIEDIKDSAHNELFCMRLAAKVGIDVPPVEIRYCKDIAFFLIARYDRIQANGAVERLHQEDFCQAMAIMPELKYEREGGPSIENCQLLLKHHSTKPAFDQLSFIKRIIFNYIIANCDAHGKNYSFLYKKNGNKPELAPAYDLLCTGVYPELSNKMAMKIGGKYNADDVFLRHWNSLVEDKKTAQKVLFKMLYDMANSCLENCRQLRKDLKNEGVESDIFPLIEKFIQDRAIKIMKQTKESIMDEG